MNKNTTYSDLSREKIGIDENVRKQIWNIEKIQPVLQSGALIRIADAMEKNLKVSEQLQDVLSRGLNDKTSELMLTELNRIQQRYERQIKGLNLKIYALNRRIAKLEK